MEICQAKKLYPAAVTLYVDAFAADAKLADDLQTGHRYNAACFACLAAAGQGKNDAQLKDKDRTSLRRQARDWLRADLALHSKQAKDDNPAQRERRVKTLMHWLNDPDLAAIRDESALAKLPAEERAACVKLWDDVKKTLKLLTTESQRTQRKNTEKEQTNKDK